MELYGIDTRKSTKKAFNPYVLENIQDAPAVTYIGGKKGIKVKGDRAFVEIYGAMRVYYYNYDRKLWICQEEIPCDSKYLY